MKKPPPQSPLPVSMQILHLHTTSVREEVSMLLKFNLCGVGCASCSIYSIPKLLLVNMDLFPRSHS